MKKVIETFVYEIPDDCEDFVTVQEYVWAAQDATCPFYDGLDNFVPDIDNHTIKIIEE